MLLEGFLHLLEVLQQSHVPGKLPGALGDAGQQRQGLAVDLAGVGLAADGQRCVKAHALCNIDVQGLDLVLVPLKEGQEGGLGAGGPLAAQGAQAVQEVVQRLQVHQDILQPQADALAQGGGLGGLEMGVAQHGQGLVFEGLPGQGPGHPQQAPAQQSHGLLQNQDVGIVGDIAAGGPQVEDGGGHRRRLGIGLQVGHHIMAQLFFKALNHRKIDVPGLGLQLRNLRIGDGQA